MIRAFPIFMSCPEESHTLTGNPDGNTPKVNGHAFLGEMWRVINGGDDRKRCDLATQNRWKTRKAHTRVSVGKMNFVLLFLCRKSDANKKYGWDVFRKRR